MPADSGFVDFRVTVSDAHNLDPDAHLIVHSAYMDWGRRGWTATLRPSGHGGDGRVGEAIGTSRRAAHVFVGSWGAHVPNNFRRQPIKAGIHEVVLAISGKSDNYAGWARALHREADVENERVRVAAGKTTVVELMLSIGPPTAIWRANGGFRVANSSDGTPE